MNFTGIILVLKSQDGVNLTHLGGPSSAASGREGAFLLQDVCDKRIAKWIGGAEPLPARTEKIETLSLCARFRAARVT